MIERRPGRLDQHPHMAVEPNLNGAGRRLDGYVRRNQGMVNR